MSKPHHHSHFLSAAALATVGSFALTASSASAVNIVDWGGNYVSANQASQLSLADSGAFDLDGDGVADDSRRHIGYSSSTPASPAVGADYSGTSAVFYGGAEVGKINSTADNGVVDLFIQDNGATDAIRRFVQTPSSAGANSNLTAVLQWKDEDFLNVGAGEQVTYGDLNSFAVQYGFGGVSGGISTKFLIETADGFFVSNTGFTGGFGGSVFTLADLDSETWAAYDPNKTIGTETGVMRPGTLSFTTTIADEAQVLSVGVFNNEFTTGFDNAELRLTSFEVDATPSVSAIPEPTTILGGGALLGMIVARRRRAVV